MSSPSTNGSAKSSGSRTWRRGRWSDPATTRVRSADGHRRSASPCRPPDPRRPGRPERVGQVRELVMSVATARVRQHPQARADETFVLKTKRRLRTLEADAVRGHAEDRHCGRPEPSDLRSEGSATLAQLARREFRRCGGRATDDVRDADPDAREAPIVEGRPDVVGDPGEVERLPEPVAGPREMMADSC